MQVLIVDDDPAIRALLTKFLAREGHAVVEAEDGQRAVALLAERAVDLIITDLVMPGLDGFGVLRHARERRPQIPTIVLTGETSVRDAVEAMRAGAFNFVTKPFSLVELGEMVQQAASQRLAKAAAAALPPAEREQPQVALVGRSLPLRAVVELVERIAGTDSTVLLTGESGTGKEVVARLLHGASARARGPLVALNCGAIPETLIESELFGHAKGAFTGATEARPGKFVQAHGGTLFLDEVGELPLGLQVKLLRVLQEREVTPVGDARTRVVDVRIIAATNRDLEAMVVAGTFRADLYYRLEILPIRLPALRERPEDIPLLARHFLDSMNRRFEREATLSEPALALMVAYPWPGNVREMENLMERLVVLSRTGAIESADLPEKMRRRDAVTAERAAAAVAVGGRVIDLAAVVAEFETSLIERALREAGGNKTRAAELLSLSRTTLLDKLKRQG